MATHQERKLLKSASLVDGAIRYLPLDRSSPPPSAWLQGASDEWTPLQLAGVFGPIKSSDTIDDWIELAHDLNVRFATLSINSPMINMAVDLSGLEGAAADPPPSLAQLLTEHVRSGDVSIANISPMKVTGMRGRGLALAQAFNDLLTAKYLLKCEVCDRLFLHAGQRPASYCGSACRKAACVEGTK